MSLVAVEHASRHYGGLVAVDDVTFAIEPGEVRAVIGPNGAGKTTLVGMISGRVQPTSGRVWFSGENITALPSYDRVMRGIVYTFQVTSIYRNLTCFDNVALAAQRRHGGNARRIHATVEAALARAGLSDDRSREAGILPYGHQRLLEVAMALVLEPRLLILDEPTQGLAPAEIVGFCDLVREIATTATVLIIEHNLKVVLELARRVTVMDQGRIIAEGSPDEIEQHPAVQRAYLGA